MDAESHEQVLIHYPGADMTARNRSIASWSIRVCALLTAVVALTGAATSVEGEGPRVGKPAPELVGTDSYGKTVALRDLRGHTVVLEWSNHQCPYVGKHYRSGNMQALQKEAVGQGVVWLTILSSAPGTQGSVTAAEANELTRSRGAAPTAVILDPSGTIGRAYDARTTPHMFVIDGAGTLVFMGGIDDKPTTDLADIATARNYVRLALTAVAAGRPVQEPVTRPYGCSVKYR
jgi:AhpC/TSA family